MIKAGVAMVAHLGGLVEEGWGYLQGTVTQSETGEPLPNVSITIQSPSWGYTISTTTEIYLPLIIRAYAPMKGCP
jgi:hypothetical protein